MASAAGGGEAPRTWRVKVADTAQRSHNPIRKIVDNLRKPDIPGKPVIPLSLGDPTVFGNFKCPETLVRAVETGLKSYKANGYIHSAGSVEARRAVARWMSVPAHPLTEEDVVIASGCSGALELAISVLLNPGDTLLAPNPGFPLYGTLCSSKGIDVALYPLRPESNWEADIPALRALIAATPSAGALLINNPSNPCGSVYSEAHLRALLAVAEEFGMPVIADEIYGNLVFPSTGAKFHPLASLTETVPILAAGGLAKEFLVPGWRVGWVAVHDRGGLLGGVRAGLFALSQLILGANSLVLHALPAVLDPAPGSPEEAELRAHRAATLEQLEANAAFTAARLAAIPGLSVVVPQGAMYVMFKVEEGALEGIDDDVAFAQALLAEEAVVVLPGQAFGIKGYCRVVFCAPKEQLAIAFDRMAAFCARRSAKGKAEEGSGAKGGAAAPAEPALAAAAAAIAADAAAVPAAES